jgi:ubiquinone/menaquinone biosynthesis C-methylase UbiE
MTDQPVYDMQKYMDFEKAGWSDIAAGYVEFADRIMPQAIGPLLDAANVKPGNVVIDVGTGPGFAAGAAMERGADTIGVDMASGMIRAAREAYPDGDFREGAAEDLPVDDLIADAVVANFGYLHFGDPDRAIAESARVLKPGGRLAFTVWSTPDRMQYMGCVTGAVMQHGDMNVDVPVAPNPFRFCDPEEAKTTLEAAGFQDVAVAEVPITGRYTVDELFNSLRQTAVRSKALLDAQDQETQQKIRDTIAANGAAMMKDGFVELSMPAVLISATKA